MTRDGLGLDRVKRHNRPIRWYPDVEARLIVPRLSPLAAPATAIDEAPTRCISVNVLWIPHIIGLLDVLIYGDVWIGDDTERDRVVQQGQALIEMMMLGGDCGMTDPCCQDEIDILNQILVVNQQIISNQETIINDNSVTVINNNSQTWNSYQTANNTVNQENITNYNGTPESIAPDIGENFSEDAGQLCAAITEYVNQVLYYETQIMIQEAAAVGIVSNAVITAMIAAAPLTAGASAAIGIAAAAVTAVSAYAFNRWLEAMNDPANKRKVICCMMDSLRNADVTQANFKTSVNDCGFDGLSPEANIASKIDQYNQYDDEWLAFLRAYNQVSPTNEGTCSCCGEEAILEQYGNYGTIITHVGGCNYHIVQPAITDPGHGGMSRAGFKDALGRPLHADYPDVGYTLQGMAGSTVIGACGDADYLGDNFGGGFIPSNRFTTAEWWVGNSEGVDTYIKITLVTDCEG